MTTGWPTRSRVKAHAHEKADPSADGTAVSARCAATAAPMPWRARAKATKNASPGPEMLARPTLCHFPLYGRRRMLTVNALAGGTATVGQNVLSQRLSQPTSGRCPEGVQGC